MPKISVIGAGNVGATAANLIAQKQLGDVVLFDIANGIPQAKALDLMQSSSILGIDFSVKGTNNYEDTKNSDIVVIAAGMPRKQGSTRDELISTNTKIVKEIAINAAQYSPKSIVIAVTNPLDAMVHIAAEVTKFPRQRVLGMGGILDSARLKHFIAEELKISANEVDAIVIGAHSDTMVPVISHAKANGTPISELISQEKINSIVERTKKGGEEILKLLGTSAFYAPGAAVTQMVSSILKQDKKILPCCVYSKEADCFIGFPVVLGKDGVERVIELKLSDEEKAHFKKSVEHVKGVVDSAMKFL